MAGVATKVGFFQIFSLTMIEGQSYALMFTCEQFSSNSYISPLMGEHLFCQLIVHINKMSFRGTSNVLAAKMGHI